VTERGSISLIIPHFPKLKGVDKALKRLVDSFDAYDELILVVNEGIGYGRAVNMGLKYAKGDYIIVSNNDIELVSGTLSDMPLYGVVSVPNIIPRPRDKNPRAFFCMDRRVYENLVEKDGYFYDERFVAGYFEDDDLILRLKRDGIKIFDVDSVTIKHYGGGGMTMKQIGEQKYFNINKKQFKEKWPNEK